MELIWDVIQKIVKYWNAISSQVNRRILKWRILKYEILNTKKLQKSLNYKNERFVDQDIVEKLKDIKTH